KEQDVLIVGAGLTATDIIVQLDRLGHRGTVHALSRRGLRPRPHVVGVAPHPAFLDAAALPTTVRDLMHRVRAQIRAGGDWRAVIDSLRPFSHALWQGFSWEERGRFMRHVRPFWEVHRHRIAPQVAAALDRLVDAGRVKFYGGRLQSLRETSTGAEAVFRKRASEELVTLNVAKVINCTGPRTDYSKYQHPLYINLLARGLIDHDPLALGLHAAPSGEVYRYRGPLSGWLYAIGAPLKGVLWESTAAPEIRVQARQIAERVLGVTAA
ncbi:MAG: FAD-dependent oxidoreductase, partial [Rariglobus sp.]